MEVGYSVLLMITAVWNAYTKELLKELDWRMRACKICSLSLMETQFQFGKYTQTMSTIQRRLIPLSKSVNQLITTQRCRGFSNDSSKKNILKSCLEDVLITPTSLPKFIWERGVKMFPNHVALVSCLKVFKREKNEWFINGWFQTKVLKAYLKLDICFNHKKWFVLKAREVIM